MTTSAQRADPPWHRRSTLWPHADEIRRLRAEGYSLRQILERLGLGLSRSTLHRWLRRADAAAARLAGGAAPAATPAAPGAAASTEEAEDAAVLALLDSSGFTPPLPLRK
jgi:transcriptional regulator with XRE-family HTH domain